MLNEPPPNVKAPSSGRDGVSRTCSVGALSPARELLRDHLRLGAAAEARGHDVAQHLGFRTRGRFLSLFYPVTAQDLRDATDGLSIVLGSALPPAMAGCLAAAQDADITGLKSSPRGLSVICRASRLGTACPAPTPLHPPPGMLRPRLPTDIPKMLKIRRKYLNQCTPAQNTACVTEKKKKEGVSKCELNVLVGSVVIGGRILLYLAQKVSLVEFLSQRIRIPNNLTTAAAACLVLGKALYTALKDTKDYSSLILYFVTLYKERAAASDASANRSTTDIEDGKK